MRRLIIVLLAIVIPLKVWAGIVHPLALQAMHGGTTVAVPDAGASASVHHAQAEAGDECCFAEEPGSALHSQECPHLSTPLFAAPPPLISIRGVPTAPPAVSPVPLRSVVLDVLLQPPLALR